MKRIIMLMLLILAGASPLAAQDVSVRIKSDSTQILIGDWFPVNVRVEAPKTYKIVFPVKDSEFTNAAYVESDSVFTEASGNMTVYTSAYTLTSFDTGSVAVSLEVGYYKPGDTTFYAAVSNEIPMDVFTVRIDTAASYRDIKEVLDVPYTWWEYLLFISLILAVLALLWYAWYRYKYRPETEESVVEEEVEPQRLAEEIALEKLRDLEQRKVWEQGMHKQYQSELSETLREYIEGKFEFPAMEQTTPEIVRNIGVKGVERNLVKEVELALQCADLTKFAKYKPDPVAHRQGLKTAYLFVEETQGYKTSVEEEAKQRPVTNESLEARYGRQTDEQERSGDDVRS